MTITTKQLLIDKYGILLTIENLAELLHREPGGVRKTLQKRDEELTKKLNPGRKKIGRLVFFTADIVADMVDQESRQ